MAFQTVVNRNYTSGFPGDIIRDGPMRAKPGRIGSATIGADPGFSTNRISRAFGYQSDQPPLGLTYAAQGQIVVVGGPVFFGVLGHPKHYALPGVSPQGSLAASLDLPIGYEGEFFDMVTGMVMELYNETGANKQMNYGDQVAYVSSAITVGQNPDAMPFGALVSLAPGAAAPAGMVIIPGAKVVNPVAMGASAPGALVSAWTIVQI
jgi:hypothetical protein